MGVLKDAIQGAVDAAVGKMTATALRLIDAGMSPKEALKQAADEAKESIDDPTKKNRPS